jgi:hypothetical protein
MPSSVDVPGTIDLVTCEWLTGVLRGSGAVTPSTSVIELAADQIGVGLGVMALLYRITPTYAPASAGPRSIVIKMASRHNETPPALEVERESALIEGAPQGCDPGRPHAVQFSRSRIRGPAPTPQGACTRRARARRAGAESFGKPMSCSSWLAN